MGDYAGDELFLIHGDSLLYKVFSNDKLDFEPGFQILHATYLVEYFLRALHQRGCKFNLVFFHGQADLCVPPRSSQDLTEKYRLARAAITQHLQSNLKIAGSPIAVKSFRSYKDRAFKEYLRESGTYFFMCHDGSSMGNEPDAGSDDAWESEDYEDSGSEDGDYEDVELEYQSNMMSEQIVGFRSMISWFISQRYNVALIDGLECRDTKVC